MNALVDGVARADLADIKEWKATTEEKVRVWGRKACDEKQLMLCTSSINSRFWLFATPTPTRQAVAAARETKFIQAHLLKHYKSTLRLSSLRGAAATIIASAPLITALIAPLSTVSMRGNVARTHFWLTRTRSNAPLTAPFDAAGVLTAV